MRYFPKKPRESLDPTQLIPASTCGLSESISMFRIAFKPVIYSDIGLAFTSKPKIPD